MSKKKSCRKPLKKDHVVSMRNKKNHVIGLHGNSFEDIWTMWCQPKIAILKMYISSLFKGHKFGMNTKH